MRIAQIIDSLAAGGAERLALSFANGLADQAAVSALIVTRAEGPLRSDILPAVKYLFAARKSTLDPAALFRTSAFIRKNNISILHAHGTSYFFAFLLKCLHPAIKIVYHEHYGARANSIKPPFALKWLSRFFSAVVVVNNQLKDWAVKKLDTPLVYFLPNFVERTEPEGQGSTKLSGMDGKRIVILANLKEPKNHLFALKAFAGIIDFYQDWSLHIVGADYHDDYSKELVAFVDQARLHDRICFYGQRSDIANILSQCSIGMLTSTSEGFPVTLLEYGTAGVPVITSNVGYCGILVENGVCGLTFDPKDTDECAAAIRLMASDSGLRQRLGTALKERIRIYYSKEKVLDSLLGIYTSVLHGK